MSNIGTDGYDYSNISSGSVDAAINNSQGGSILNQFSGWLNDNNSWLSGLGNTAGQVYSIDRALSEANRISDLGNYLNDWSNQQGLNLNSNAQFKGYGITSGLGQSTGGISSNGGFGLNFGVGADPMMEAQSLYQRNLGSGMMADADIAYDLSTGMVNGVNYMGPANQAIGQSLADPSDRQQEIYNQMMAVQNPELNRQQALQQANEYRMGRGGIRGSAYGGTAEDAAMARARSQASNEAVIAAMSQADNERKMLSDMGANYGNLFNQQTQNMRAVGDSRGQLGLNRIKMGLGQEEMKYLPMKMQLELLREAKTGMDAQQTGQLTGLGYLSEMMLGGMGHNVNSQKVSAELRGNLYNALLSNLGGSQGSDGSSSSGLGGFLSDIAGGLDFVTSIFGDD